MMINGFNILFFKMAYHVKNKEKYLMNLLMKGLMKYIIFKKLTLIVGFISSKLKELFRKILKIKYKEAKYKAKHGEGLKILTPKQMLKKLPIALAQVKAGNTSENLLNEFIQVIYSLYLARDITKNIYNNTVNSIKL